jgi:hypothetical protein
MLLLNPARRAVLAEWITETRLPTPSGIDDVWNAFSKNRNQISFSSVATQAPNVAIASKTHITPQTLI